MPTNKKKKLLAEDYYFDSKKSSNLHSSKKSPVKIITIAVIALVIIIVLILAFNLSSQKNNLLFFGPDGNTLASKITVSVDGKLIDSLTTDGEPITLAGNPNDSKKITISSSGISLINKNISGRIVSSGGITLITLNADDFFVDENGGIHFTVNPFQDLGVGGYIDENTGEFVYTDTNMDVFFDIIIEDLLSGETTIVQLPGKFFFSEFNQRGCVGLSRSSFAASIHYGYLDSSFKIKFT